MKIRYALIAMVLALMVIGPAIGQETNNCRIEFNWDAPGYYADGECTDISDDSMTTEEQAMLNYQYRYRKVGEALWSAPLHQQETTLFLKNIQCGTIELEVKPYFTGGTPDCPAIATKVSREALPGCVTFK